MQKKLFLLLKSDFSFVRSIKCHAQVWGVAVDPGDNIHVGTTECVDVFDFKGMKITGYGQQYLSKAGDIQFPATVHCKYSFVTECHHNGEIYMPKYSGEIFFFNWKTNTVLHRITTSSHPLGLQIDQSGHMNMCCYDDKEIQTFIW